MLRLFPSITVHCRITCGEHLLLEAGRHTFLPKQGLDIHNDKVTFQNNIVHATRQTHTEKHNLK